MNWALQDKAVELAWRQWTALGVAGVAPLPEQGLDLEALIAFTPFAAAADPRLERECLDWCVRIGPNRVSVSRLPRITRMFKPHADPDAVDLSSIASAGQADRVILHRGLDLSGKSRSPRLEHPALVQLRSRHIFGVGARSDVITELVMNHSVMVRLSAMRPGYRKRAMALAMEDLASAGVVTKLIINQTAHYKLIQEAPPPLAARAAPRQAARMDRTPRAGRSAARRLETHAQPCGVQLCRRAGQGPPPAPTAGRRPRRDSPHHRTAIGSPRSHRCLVPGLAHPMI